MAEIYQLPENGNGNSGFGNIVFLFLVIYFLVCKGMNNFLLLQIFLDDFLQIMRTLTSPVLSYVAWFLSLRCVLELLRNNG